ncbi:cytochrome c [Roseomonas eburnea]|uniref:Cytochrome c n=1 Tax=Neoroseomonas eburnea TaxID=1346889 RepID=A0A9X9XHK7_9PROT|nr:cytochrome c [Neoroseomonas eburnea]MBR0683193.1 cytochrome c [Neoroseomonas eburnea]
MRSWALVAGFGLLALGAGVALAQQSPSDLSAERRGLMRQQVQAVRAIAPVVQGGGDPRTVQPQAEAVLATARRKLTMFPPGSDRDDDRARPEIWTDRATFDRDGQALVDGATALVAASAAGDRAAFAAAFQAATNACNACHDRFRLPQRP